LSVIADRFRGDAGKQNLIDALLQHALVRGDHDLASEFAKRATVIEVPAGEKIIAQGDSDNDLFLILSGAFDIVVNGRIVAARGRGDHVGEMALVEPSQRRSADVVATESALVAKFSYKDVTELASRDSTIYRVIAQNLARRLLERNKLVGAHRDVIRVFIISSAEALEVARVIQTALSHDGFVVTLWTDGVFKVTSYALDSLEAAVFRGNDWPTPRDNVVFELGLFMGRLGRNRAILMEPREGKVKLPSDLAGVTTIPYVYKAGKDANALMGPACNQLRDHIKQCGLFNG
jgi:CRP/FNR family transcriptional regulator, cyclic AMP receptor protein